MSPPPIPDGQTAADALRHVDQGSIARAVGWAIGTLASIVIALLGYIGIRESRKTSKLFEWKDQVVDPFMADVPKQYVSKHDLELYVHTPNREDHEEIKTMIRDQGKAIESLRGLLVERATKG